MAKTKSRWDKRKLYVMFYYEESNTSPYNNAAQSPIHVIDFFGYANYRSAYQFYIANKSLPSIGDKRIHTMSYRDFKYYNPYFFMRD